MILAGCAVRVAAHAGDWDQMAEGVFRQLFEAFGGFL